MTEGKSLQSPERCMDLPKRLVQPNTPISERCTVRNSRALHDHWLTVRSLLLRYDTHEPGLCALICTLASPEVCSRATPGDGRKHENEHEGALFDCGVCQKPCCNWCEWGVYCVHCHVTVRQCGRCNVRPWRCPYCATVDAGVYFVPNTPSDIRERDWRSSPSF